MLTLSLELVSCHILCGLRKTPGSGREGMKKGQTYTDNVYNEGAHLHRQHVEWSWIRWGSNHCQNLNLSMLVFSLGLWF